MHAEERKNHKTSLESTPMFVQQPEQQKNHSKNTAKYTSGTHMEFSIYTHERVRRQRCMCCAMHEIKATTTLGKQHGTRMRTAQTPPPTTAPSTRPECEKWIFAIAWLGSQLLTFSIFCFVLLLFFSRPLVSFGLLPCIVRSARRMRLGENPG